MVISLGGGVIEVEDRISDLEKAIRRLRRVVRVDLSTLHHRFIEIKPGERRRAKRQRAKVRRRKMARNHGQQTLDGRGFAGH
jgi:hypothetical protein